jgi:hypothetical protein
MQFERTIQTHPSDATATSGRSGIMQDGRAFRQPWPQWSSLANIGLNHGVSGSSSATRQVTNPEELGGQQGMPSASDGPLPSHVPTAGPSTVPTSQVQLSIAPK